MLGLKDLGEILTPARIGLAVRLGLMALAGALVLGFMWRYGTVRVPEWNDQMAPGIVPGGRVLVQRRTKRASEFARGEIAAYAVRSSDGVSARFGRVAGLPGDRVEVRAGGEVLVNGEPAPSGPELVTPASGDEPAGAEAGPRTEVVPAKALFLLNDRRSSRLADSRKLGPIPEEALAGKVVMSW